MSTATQLLAYFLPSSETINSYYYIVDIAVSGQAPQHEAKVGVAYLISHPGYHPNYK